MLLLEVPNVLPNVFEMGLLGRSGNDVVGAVFLVRCDEVGVVDRRLRHDLLEVRAKLVQKFRFKNLEKIKLKNKILEEILGQK